VTSFLIFIAVVCGFLGLILLATEWWDD